MNYKRFSGNSAPFHKIIESVVCSAWKTTTSSLLPHVGGIRSGELSGFLRPAIRGGFRIVQDHLDPYLTLIEEREGFGLDYAKIDLGDNNPFGFRWNKQKASADIVRRNKSGRTNDMLGQGFMFEMELDNQKLPIVTLAIKVADFYYEAGKLSAWLKHIRLVKENKLGGFSVVREIARYEKHQYPALDDEAVSPKIVLTEAQREIEELSKKLRKELG